MQVHVRFNKDERVQWSVKVDDIDK